MIPTYSGSATNSVFLTARLMNVLSIQFYLLQGEICKDWSKGLAVGRPVGVEFNNPRDTIVFLQLLLVAESHTTTLDWILKA